MSDLRAHVAYRQLLMRSGHGYPLWIPEPDAGLPVDYQREGVTIGDLGLLTAGGGFDFIFNVHVDAGHPVNAGGVPPDFVPLPICELGVNPIRRTLPMHRPQAAITSADVSRRSLSVGASAEAPGLAGGGFGIEFSTTRTQAAILMLPSGANRYDAKNRSVYEKYAAQHAKSWYQYVNVALGRRACSGTLYLITGCDKCFSWGAAAFCHPESSTEVSLKFFTGGLGGGSLSLGSSWDASIGVETRLFPIPGISTYGYENQCVFTRGLCIAIRDKLFKQIFSRSVTVSWINGDPDDYQPTFDGYIPFSSSSSSSSSVSPPSSQPSPPSDSQQSSSEASGSPREDDGVQRSNEDSHGFLKSELLNPSSRLSRYIIHTCPEAEVAIVHDEDWLVEVNQAAENDDLSLPSLLRASKEPVVINGVGCFQERPVDRPAPRYAALSTLVHDSLLTPGFTHSGPSTSYPKDEFPVHFPSHTKDRHDSIPVNDDTVNMLAQKCSPPVPSSPHRRRVRRKLNSLNAEGHSNAVFQNPIGTQKNRNRGVGTASSTVHDFDAVQVNGTYAPSHNVFEGGGSNESAKSAQTTTRGISRTTAPPMATCQQCKKRDLKCELLPKKAICRFCESKGLVCIGNTQRSRTSSYKLEDLLAHLRHQDAIIDSLYKIHFPNVRGHQEDLDQERALRAIFAHHSSDLQTAPADLRFPLGQRANVGTSNQIVKKKTSKVGDREMVINANETYFMPGPVTNPCATILDQRPEILAHGLLTPYDVDELFKIFYERINPFISLLDPTLHTPQTTFTRDPVLFTVICAISSRYHLSKSWVYPIAMHFAKHSAANAVVNGCKSLELCQAYILMATYAIPARTWEQDRSWLYAGLAIRIATDLNLHQMPSTKSRTPELEREQLNRQRVWQLCFNLDRSMAIQFGKPTTIWDDRVIDGCAESSNKGTYNLAIREYTDLWHIVARFQDEVFARAGSGTLNLREIDFKMLTPPFDEELTAFEEEWKRRLCDEEGDLGAQMRCRLLPFLVAYSRLVIFSSGFQQAYSLGIQISDDVFFNKCFDSAKTVVRCMTEELIPTGYMPFAPDDYFVFAAFASAFLLKLLRPEYQMFRTGINDDEILNLIATLVHQLGSPSVAIDEKHLPKVYARFLGRLLDSHKPDGWVPVTIPLLHGPSVQDYGQHQHPHQSFDIVQSQALTYNPKVTYAGGSGASIQFAGNLDDFDWPFAEHGC